MPVPVSDRAHQELSFNQKLRPRQGQDRNTRKGTGTGKGKGTKQAFNYNSPDLTVHTASDLIAIERPLSSCGFNRSTQHIG